MSTDIFSFVTPYASSFARAQGAMLLLPIGEGLISVFALRTILALFMTYACGIESSESLSLHALIVEVIIGVCLTLPLALVVNAASSLGEVFDTGRGQNIASLLDPLHETFESSTALILRTLVFAQLLMLGVLEDLFGIYRESFTLLSSAVIHFNHEGLIDLLEFCQWIFTGSFSLCLPWLLIFLLIEVFLCFVSRALPQVSLSGESFQLKSILGAGLLACTYTSGRWEELRVFCREAPLRLVGAIIHAQ
jgi:type III secretory pathway component EscT